MASDLQMVLSVLTKMSAVEFFQVPDFFFGTLLYLFRHMICWSLLLLSFMISSSSSASCACNTAVMYCCHSFLFLVHAVSVITFITRTATFAETVRHVFYIGTTGTIRFTQHLFHRYFWYCLPTHFDGTCVLLPYLLLTKQNWFMLLLLVG